MFYEKIDQKGRSTIEMLGVLAIIGVLTVGGISGYSQAMSKVKSNKMLDQIQMLIQNIRTTFGTQRTYAGLTTKNAYKSGILTDESYNTDTEKGVSPFGGEIVLSTGSTVHTFKIKYTKIPAESCVKIVTADWGADPSSGLEGITVTADMVDTEFSWTPIQAKYGLPVTVPGAVEACSSPMDNAITWKYR